MWYWGWGLFRTRRFGEAWCAVGVFGANRAAAALYRSTLEKVLKANGYRKEVDPKVNDLFKGIDAACNDNLKSEARKGGRTKMFVFWGMTYSMTTGVKSLMTRLSGRILTQRILEDFYDDRETVLEALKEKKGLPEEKAAEARPNEAWRNFRCSILLRTIRARTANRETLRSRHRAGSQGQRLGVTRSEFGQGKA